MAVGRIFGNHRAGAGSGGAGGSDRPAQSATGLPCTVLLPLEPEAREICRQYCRDRNIDTLDLPQAEKWCMIKEND